MNNLLIIGARGFGREIFYLATECPGYGSDFIVKGFLDDNKHALEGFDSYPPIISTVEDYVVDDDDVFICAVGDVRYKKRYIGMIRDKGGEFISLIHPTAIVDVSARVGKGSVIFPYVTLGADSVVGDYVVIMKTAVVSHDTVIGDYSRIDCNVVCVGGSVIMEEVTVHTSAIINKDIMVEKGAVVGAGSFVIRKVKENTTVFGNPAVRLKGIR
jgi:sugar O-acyltransferase (sialic acid O-acetyltransferase NeuD family)